jgi:hypothetical protein
MKLKLDGMVAAALLAMVVVLPAAPAAAQPLPQDVITVGTVTTSSNTVDVPVYIRDVSGTPLGIDQPPGSRIQSMSIKVDYSLAASVQSVTFTRAGITTALTPTFESSPSSPGTITLLVTFQESTNLIPFTSNAAAPGNQVGQLHFTLAPGVVPGTTIILTLDSVLTQLTDEGGSGATKETVTAGNLALVNGAINVVAPPTDVPALNPYLLLLLSMTLAAVGLRFRT